MMYLANAFSLSMLAVGEANIRVNPISVEEAKALFNKHGMESFVGHADTALVLSSILGIEVPMHRGNLSLYDGSEVIVAQLMGGRLPEGVTTLPEGFSFSFMRVKVNFKKPCGAYTDRRDECNCCNYADGHGCCQSRCD